MILLPRVINFNVKLLRDDSITRWNVISKREKSEKFSRETSIQREPYEFSEGFLTTCSFDYLTDDEDTRTFVITIFFWAYVLPMLLIIYFYSQLLKSIRTHEKMLRDQVSEKFCNSRDRSILFYDVAPRENMQSLSRGRFHFHNRRVAYA